MPESWRCRKRARLDDWRDGEFHFQRCSPNGTATPLLEQTLDVDHCLTEWIHSVPRDKFFVKDRVTTVANGKECRCLKKNMDEGEKCAADEALTFLFGATLNNGSHQHVSIAPKTVIGWYIAIGQYSSLCEGAVVLTLGGVNIEDGVPRRVQVECGREEVNDGEKQEKDRTRTNNAQTHIMDGMTME